MDDINDLEAKGLKLEMTINGSRYIKSSPISIPLGDLSDAVEAMAAELLMDLAEDYPEE